LFAAELPELIESCDWFTTTNRMKAARNLANAEVFLVDQRHGRQVYPIYWLLHVRGGGGKFSDSKRSNQNLMRFIPELFELGFVEISEGDAGFETAWAALISECQRLDTTPSKRNGRPDWTGRRFYVRMAETISDIQAASQPDFQRKIFESSIGTHAARLARLEVAPINPRKSKAVVVVYIRNPDVVAEALFRAKGVCERCGKNAPFRSRRYNEPFLEVHHIVPLAEDGPDTLENVQAICPNCHRQAHFG
jgi:hypothetical protein